MAAFFFACYPAKASAALAVLLCGRIAAYPMRPPILCKRISDAPALAGSPIIGRPSWPIRAPWSAWPMRPPIP